MLKRINKSGPEVYNVPVLEKLGFKTFVTGRHGGVSKKPFDSLNAATSVGDNADDVTKNMRLIKKTAGISKLYLPNQVHGDEIVVIDNPDLPEIAKADAVIVTISGVVAAVRTADCVPILLADPVRNIAGAVHAGRQGAEIYITSKTVAIMVDLGSNPADIIAVIGPCIRKCCYEVDEAVATNFHACCGGDGGLMLDIAKACETQLKGAGLALQNVHDASICTSCNSATFFSYRKDGGVTGRFVSGIEVRST